MCVHVYVYIRINTAKKEAHFKKREMKTIFSVTKQYTVQQLLCEIDIVDNSSIGDTVEFQIHRILKL